MAINLGALVSGLVGAMSGTSRLPDSQRQVASVRLAELEAVINLGLLDASLQLRERRCR